MVSQCWPGAMYLSQRIALDDSSSDEEDDSRDDDERDDEDSLLLEESEELDWLDSEESELLDDSISELSSIDDSSELLAISSRELSNCSSELLVVALLSDCWLLVGVSSVVQCMRMSVLIITRMTFFIGGPDVSMSYIYNFHIGVGKCRTNLARVSLFNGCMVTFYLVSLTFKGECGV